MVSLTAGVQEAPPSTLKSYLAYATLRPCACPEKPGTPNRLTRTTAAPVAAATSTAPISRLLATVDVTFFAESSQ